MWNEDIVAYFKLQSNNIFRDTNENQRDFFLSIVNTRPEAQPAA
jgi:hypothetical protein